MPKGPKPLDAAAKLTAELDLTGLLLLLGLIPPDEDIEIEPIEREAVLPQLRIDHGCRLKQNGAVRVQVLEFLARWISGIGLRLRRYHRGSELKHSRPVDCDLVLLSKKGAPKWILKAGRYGEHRFRGDTGEPFLYRIHKMWEIPASTLLSMGRNELYPFVPLSAHTAADILEADRRIGASGDRSLRMRLRTFCGVNYGQEEMLKLLGEGGDMLMEEIARESSIVQAIARKASEEARAQALRDGKREGRRLGRRLGRQEGLREGLREGLQEGRLEERREILTSTLSDRFPSLATMPQIRELGYEGLAAALKGVIRARTAAEARKAIQGAASK